MPTLSIAEVQDRLPQLIDQLRPGEEVVITRGNVAVARIVGPPLPQSNGGFGCMKGMLTIVSEDDEHLDDFAEYMP